MKTVAFYQPFMNERGTCVAMFDYAWYNQTLLGNKSIFVYDSKDSRNHSGAIKHIQENFSLHDINCSDYIVTGNSSERSTKIDSILEKEQCTHVYLCKSGYNDGVIPKKSKSLVHVMGMVPPSEKHGDVWAYVSLFSNQVCSGGKECVLPYMVNLPDETSSMREDLHIPKNAIVFGRHGGIDTFDDWAYEMMGKILKERPEVYFLLLNTPKKLYHDRVIHLGCIVDPTEKVRFINTCDAMIHIRWVGETFGMACAEFSSRNRPVITDIRSPERNHIDILGDKGIYFKNQQEAFSILLKFKPDFGKDWNCYKEYSPKNVMNIFNRVFLES